MSTQRTGSVGERNEWREIIERWCRAFEDLVGRGDARGAGHVFASQAIWRDLLAFTWDIRSAIGLEAIEQLMANDLEDVGLEVLALADEGAPQWVEGGAGGPLLCAQLTLSLRHGVARAIVDLVPDREQWLAASLMTELTELHGQTDRRTRWDDATLPEFSEAEIGRSSWLERRSPGRAFPTSSPTVLVVGAGQSGLALAAHLDRLGVENIVVEKAPRVGDSWRRRYESLITHTPSFTDHLPFLQFPDSWPIVTPKDKLASWLESYADALDIDVWTETEVVGGTYDPSEARWTVQLRRSSGAIEVLSPDHLVLATGLLAIPSIPDLAGRDEFSGEVIHSSQFSTGAKFQGKKAVVVGSGASGHDIVQDLYQNGLTDITLVQRSETYVLSFARGMKLLYSPFYDADSASDLDAADSGFSMLPLSALSEASKQAVPLIADEDEQLLRDLEGIGFKLNWDGIFENALRKGAGGYYINQGASELLTQGKVALRRGEVTGFDKTGVVFADGGRLDADVVVLCTGYENMRESARLLLGEDVYAQCTEVFTPDATRGGEHGSLWTDSGHPQLWFMGGSLHYARLYSGKLALRIKAEVEGIVRRSPRPSFR